MSTKISEFVKITSVDANGLLNVVQNGQNFSITQENYLAQFGVTGTIVQAGASSGTPILNIEGTVNEIRTVEDGPGIVSGVSAENGLTLAHNFTVNQVGAPIMLNPTQASPTFPSLIGSDSIAVEQVGNQIKFETTAEPVSTSTVIINEIADFPTAVGGVITLADDTDYFITNDMTTADRFVLGISSQIRSVSTVINTLTYTGTGAMFSCEDCDVRLRNITFVASSGSIFNITSSTSAGIGIVFSDNVVFVADKLGEMSCRIFSMISCGVVLATDGLNITGTTMEVLSILTSNWFVSAGTCIDLNSTVFESAEASNLFVTYEPGVTFLAGLTGSGNIAADGQGTVLSCKLIGTGTPLSNMAPDDDLWFFAGSNQIRDTIRDGICSMQGNSTETVISSSGVPVLVAGTFVVGRSSGFTPSTAGRVTYDILKDVVIPISVTMTVQMATGGSDDVRAMIAINGTSVSESSIGTSVNSSGKGNITLSWQEEISTDDFIEVYIQNDTDTTNIIVEDMILRVN